MADPTGPTPPGAPSGRYRASCRGCDWATEGTRDEIDDAVERHRDEHRAARAMLVRCLRRGCEWTMRGSRTWVHAAWRRHLAEHQAADEARQARREARYRWKGRPNPTQVRLLRAVKAGRVLGYECQVHAGEAHVARWYPTGLSERDHLWWPALVSAGLVRPRRTFRRGGVQRGVWRLTGRGRAVLTETDR